MHAGSRSGSGSAQDSAVRGAPEELVFALCHEVGNLVGAIRLNAHLIDGDASAVELAHASVEIDDSASRIRSLLALIRPLLAGSEGAQPSLVEPGALLRGVREALEEYGGRAVGIEVADGEALPEVEARHDVLHHLLVSFAYYAVEEARPRGQVRVAARFEAGARIAFQLEDDAAADDALPDFLQTGRTGRALLCRVANRLLEAWNGTMSVHREADTTRVILSLPIADPT